MATFVHQSGSQIVVTEDAWQSNDLHIWLYERQGPRTVQLVPGEHGWLHEELPEGTYDRDRKPSLIIPRDFVGDLAAALAGHSPPNLATTRHLDDAIVVRDRMVALVEKLTDT